MGCGATSLKSGLLCFARMDFDATVHCPVSATTLLGTCRSPSCFLAVVGIRGGIDGGLGRAVVRRKLSLLLSLSRLVAVAAEVVVVEKVVALPPPTA